MQLFKRQQTRLLCFILLLIAVLMLCNRLLVKTDTSRYLMLEELQGEEGFQIAFVGSSPVYYSIDPDIIEKDTGFKSIDAAIGNAGLESCGALVNTFLRKESAQMVILTLEPQMLIEEMITTGHARALLAVESGDLQYTLAMKAFDRKLSVREVERMIRGIASSKKKKDVLNPQMEAVYHSLEERVKNAIGSKVTIRPKSKKKGKIEIEYYSEDDLERIIDLLQSVKR